MTMLMPSYTSTINLRSTMKLSQDIDSPTMNRFITVKQLVAIVLEYCREQVVTKMIMICDMDELLSIIRQTMLLRQIQKSIVQQCR